MKNMKRSIRRHHYARIKKNWKERLRWSWYWDNPDNEFIDLVSCRLTSTHTQCSSCIGHINPRTYEGVTLPEKRNLLSYQEDLMGL